ncbi:MAG: hypothetical protein M9962_15770 [Oligoflexia bacterium]|nr:hypothetical protein [Oligoflexia bacterium]
MNKKNEKWLNEYQAFLAFENSEVPKEISEKIYSHMNKLLNPSFSTIFVKLFFINLVAGFFSLSVCHQFGMNPFGTESSLDAWFMQMWGHHICMFVCGSLFIGLPILVSGFLMTIEEIKSLRSREFVQIFSLGVCFLILFSLFGVEFAAAIAGLWLLGALVGGCLATEIIWLLRKYPIKS